ncbi:hypothetical protein GCM10010470_12830 [Saccharopolyspora taberi]|uniref:Uncharacterized protein n=1 Tax=Saccharopolyspora taberi TaxID=60895 RepID=A0ABN3V6H7_9PSEU
MRTTSTGSSAPHATISPPLGIPFSAAVIVFRRSRSEEIRAWCTRTARSASTAATAEESSTNSCIVVPFPVASTSRVTGLAAAKGDIGGAFEPGADRPHTPRVWATPDALNRGRGPSGADPGR